MTTTTPVAYRQFSWTATRWTRRAWRAVAMVLAWTAIVTAGSTAEVAEAQEPPATPPYSCVVGADENGEGGLLLGSWVPCNEGFQPPSLLNEFLLAPQGRWLGSIYTATDDQRAALRRLEREAVENVMQTHVLPPGDERAVRSWGRSDALAELWALIVLAIATPADQRTTDQAQVVQWMSEVLHRNGVEAAEAAAFQYLLWAGHDPAPLEAVLAAPGAPSADAVGAALRVGGDPVGNSQYGGFCNYFPPAPFEATWNTALPECLPCQNPLGCVPAFPEFDTVKQWGLAANLADALNNEEFVRVARDIAGAIAFGVGVAVAAAAGWAVGTALAAAGVIAIGGAVTLVDGTVVAAMASALVQAIMPFAGTVATVVGAIAAIVTIVVLAIIVLVLHSIQIGDAVALPGKLADLVAGAHTQPRPDPAAEVATDDGMSTMFSLFVLATMPAPEGTCDNRVLVAAGNQTPRPCLNPTAIPEPTERDPRFEITPQGSSTATLEPSLDYRDDLGAATTTRVTDSWFVHRRPGEADSQSLRVSYTDWDGSTKTAWVYSSEESETGHEFVVIRDATSTDQPIGGDCADDSRCAVTDTLEMLAPGGEKLSVRLVAPPPPLPDDTPPTVEIEGVDSPRTDAVTSVTVTFSEPMMGNPTFRLTRDGEEIDPLTCQSCLIGQLPDRSWWGVPLADTSAEGTYVFTVFTGRMTDLVGHKVAGGAASVTWVVDRPPVATFEPVVSPRREGVDELRLTFSEAVTGVDVSDFRLFQDGFARSLTGVTVEGSGAEYVLRGLGPLTSAQNTYSGYELLLRSSGTGIVDATGNPPARDAAGETGFVRFFVDWLPTVAIDPVSPGLRARPLDEVVFRFSEPMTGFGAGDIRLRRDGVDIDISGVRFSASPAEMVHTMTGLGSLTATDGIYELSAVTGGEVRDHTGNALGDGATVTFTVDQTPPQTAITLGPAIADGDNGWYVSPVDVAVAVDDDTATVRCVLDPAEAPTGFADLPSGPCEIGTVDSDGDHTVYAASIDEAGNDGPVSDATFRVDRTAPTASIVLDPVTPDGPRGWYVDPVKITIGVDDDTATVRCVSNPATVPTSFADLPDRPCHPLRITRPGHYVVYAAAIDRAGNTGPLVHTRFKSVGSRRCQGLVPTHVGTLGDDMIHGSPGSDVIVALGGDDVIRGRGGNDVVCGGPGNDRIHGGAGNDRLDGGRGRDQLDGQADNDIVAGGPGNDRLDGGDGRDWLDARSGNDLIFAGDGDDTVHGRRGHDLVFGGLGNDRLYGGPGNDALFGGPGNDRLHGHAGNDRLVGGRGVDQLRGGSGRNRTATTIAPR